MPQRSRAGNGFRAAAAGGQRAQGVLTWDPALVQGRSSEELQACRDSRPGAPRLFLPTAGARPGEVGFNRLIAGRSTCSGRHVFDAIRELEKGLSAGDVLLLLYGCTHFCPSQREMLALLCSGPTSGVRSPTELEWQLARTLSAVSPSVGWHMAVR